MGGEADTKESSFSFNESFFKNDLSTLRQKKALNFCHLSPDPKVLFPKFFNRLTRQSTLESVYSFHFVLWKACM